MSLHSLTCFQIQYLLECWFLVTLTRNTHTPPPPLSTEHITQRKMRAHLTLIGTMFTASVYGKTSCISSRVQLLHKVLQRCVETALQSLRWVTNSSNILVLNFARSSAVFCEWSLSQISVIFVGSKQSSVKHRKIYKKYLRGLSLNSSHNWNLFWSLTENSSSGTFRYRIIFI